MYTILIRNIGNLAKTAPDVHLIVNIRNILKEIFVNGLILEKIQSECLKEQNLSGKIN